MPGELRDAQGKPGKPREAQGAPGKPKDAQRSPGKPRGAQGGPGRPKEAQRNPGRPRKAQGSPGRLREAPGYPGVCILVSKLQSSLSSCVRPMGTGLGGRAGCVYVCCSSPLTHLHTSRTMTRSITLFSPQSPWVPRSGTFGQFSCFGWPKNGVCAVHPTKSPRP